MTEYKEVSTSQHEAGQRQRVTSFKITQLIWWVLGLLEALLGLRFLFKLIGANPNNPFAIFLYELTDFFVRPFATLTGAPAAGNMVFEFSTLITMIVYALIAWGLERLLYVIFYRPRGPVSVRQTTVSDHVPAQASSTSTRTTTTEDTNVHTP